jgi:hypothetical protein
VDAAAVEKNWQGSASLALALIGAGFIGIFFGILGLKSVKAARANNHGVALAGTILSGISIVVVSLIIFLRLTTNLLAPSLPPGDLAVGTCIQDTGLVINSEAQDVMTIQTASCARAHYGEVYYQGTLTTTTLPDADSLDEDVYNQCLAHAPERIVTKVDLYIQYYYPSSESWKAGDRGFTCALVAPEGVLVGHLIDSP